MLYSLNDLLTKLGAPEVRQKGHMRWMYFDQENSEIAGHAQICLVDDGKTLLAELQHPRHNYEDDSGRLHATYKESFSLHAERIGTQYKVTKIAFDGEEYPHPQKSIIELGLSLFHARALDISILMLEQSFNKQDILHQNSNEPQRMKNVPQRLKTPLKKEAWGVVVPFRPRRAGAMRSL